MKKSMILAITLALNIGFVTPLMAQEKKIIPQQSQPKAQPAKQFCADHESVTSSLNTQYSEGRAAIGLTNNGQVFELFADKNGSSFTVMLTKPNGETCLIFAGEHLELIKDLKGIEISFPNKK